MAKNFEELRNQMSPERRARNEARTQAMLQELLIAEIRETSGSCQTQIASVTEVDQSGASIPEQENDMQISTLRQIIETHGGKLELIAKMPSGDVNLSQVVEGK